MGDRAMQMKVERHEPIDRAAWLAMRRRAINASEIGGLVPDAKHPYETPYHLFAAKSGLLREDFQSESPAMARGRALEPVAVQFAAEALGAGHEIEYNAAHNYWHAPEIRIGATPDLLVRSPDGSRGVVQIKSIEPSIYRQTWLDDEPPLWVALQALVEAKLTGADWAKVAALRVGWRVDFNLVNVPPLPDGAWSRLVAEVAVFWRMVELGQPPAPDFGRDIQTIRELNAISGDGSIDLSHDAELVAAVVERERLRRAAKEFDMRCDELEAFIRYKAADNAVVMAGDYRLSLKMENRAGYTVAPSSRRVLRIKRIRNER
jgi:hypothetical protein